LVDADEEAGIHQVTWDSRDDRGREVVQGIYYAQLATRGFKASRKVVLLR
jgi:flagellar hook assembly protein FlgD